MSDDPERLDAPNQQVVRPDQSGPADEGKGAGKARSRSTGDEGKRGPGRPRKATSGSEGASPDDAGNGG